MNKLISSINSHTYTVETFSLPIPNHCPCCHTALIPTHLSSSHIDNGMPEKNSKLVSLYLCPKCEDYFLAHYSIFTTSSNIYIPSGNLSYLTPYGDEQTVFSDKINSLSPNFVKIYHQSEKSEHIGLTEICGLGYRKALEFLVKDYAITFNPDKIDSIKSTMLSPCINEYIDNQRIKSLATASAWLGNDETHYVRKHDDYNLKHLKAFISAIVSYIDSELSYLEAESLLNKSKK